LASNLRSFTKAVSVDAAMLQTLEKAAQLYEGLANGTYSLFRHRDYMFLEPDRAVARDHADRLRDLRSQLP
jgi:hypothetical protein